MRVLLSIKPEYATKIFNGTKRFEYRRSIFKNKDVKTVVVYASSPVQKVVGEFDIEQILWKELGLLWEDTKGASGISRSCFFDYFTGKETGYAIQIKKVKKYRSPKCIREAFDCAPPQSFLYLPSE